MLAHLLAAFRRLFITRKSRVAVGLLIVVTAVLPISEMLVLRLFSSLIIAIVLFLGLCLLAGQLGTFSAHIMRFARASARRGDV